MKNFKIIKHLFLIIIITNEKSKYLYVIKLKKKTQI